MDETISTDVPNNEPSPVVTGDATAPQTAAPGGNGDVEPQAPAEASSTESGESAAPTFTVPETDDDLKDLQSQQHVQALIQTRQHARALEKDLGRIKPLESWQPLAERFNDPAEVQSGLELLDALATPVLNNGQPVLDTNQLPVTDASPFITKLAATRPAQATALIEAALNAQLVENGVRDTAFNWKLRDLGLDPADIDGYKAWKQQGAPVAKEAIDLSTVPPKYHEVLKQLPAHIQEDRLAMPEEARNWQLERDLRDFERDQRDEQFQKQAQVQFETDISQATEKVVDEGFQKGFNQFLQQISSWQPTADPNVNKTYHLELASSLVNLLDARMEFANRQLLEAAGIPYDPEILQLNESYQRNAALAERYKAHNVRQGNRYAAEYAEAQKATDRDYLRLIQKIEGVSAKLIEHKNKTAKAETGAEEAANNGSRPTVTGAPAGQNGSSGVNPDWYKAYQRTA